MAHGLTISGVLEELREEFPDLTVSKVRFLDAQGLVSPKRSDSGYRRYSHEDIDRLRFVLRAQRDRFWPLKVIRDALDAYDRGLTPDEDVMASAVPAVPAQHVDEDVPSEEQLTAAPRENLSLTRDELARGAQASTSLIDDLVTFGLIRADSGGHFDADALAVATAAAGLAEFGVQARHLRPFRLAADREVGLVEQVPLRDTTQRVTIAQRAFALHIALVKAGLRH